MEAEPHYRISKRNAALEQKFGILDAGSTRDLDQAFAGLMTKDLVANNCICGFHLHSNGFEDSTS
jgi:hypothetical protein